MKNSLRMVSQDSILSGFIIYLLCSFIFSFSCMRNNADCFPHFLLLKITYFMPLLYIYALTL